MKSTMDEHGMTSGIVPVRQPSYFPRMVKLPRRYEKAALGDPKTARYRKVSLCGAPLHMRQSMSDRMDDLMTAIMWVKQEMILLRQHDILLKRQFFGIHDSIQTLQRQENANNVTHSIPSSASSSCISNQSKSRTMENISEQNDIINNNKLGINNNNNTLVNSRLNTASPSFSLSTSPSPSQSPLTFKKKRHPNGINNNMYSSQSFLLDALTVRSSSSATVLNNHDDNSDDDTDGDDVFDTSYFRPRTSSMRTSRDMAALARRRGSKDLV